jgi:hypothetical protein
MPNSLRRPGTGGNSKPRRQYINAHLIVAVAIGILIVSAAAVAFAYSSCGWKGILLGRSFLGFWTMGFCG